MVRTRSDDEVLNAWPWFGGMPGRAARRMSALWVTGLVVLVVGGIYAIATLQICVAAVFFVIVVVLAVLPTAGLIGSRI